MPHKILILYKASVINDNIDTIKSYCKLFDYVDFFFMLCDKKMDNDMMINNHIITLKLEEDNWSSLLIKTIKSFNHFKDKKYTHIIVSNVNTFINIPILYNKLCDNECMACTGSYTFKNTQYIFPSGAGYIFNINTVKNICDFFYNNNYISDNKLTNEFIKQYPSTDDIFFGYYLHINNIKINELERYNILKIEPFNTKINYNIIPHIRIKTGNNLNDYNIHTYLSKLIYQI